MDINALLPGDAGIPGRSKRGSFAWRTPITALTPRQQEILRLVRQGKSNKAIAALLGISEGTVKNHITEIFRVLNATNRTQAAQLDKHHMFDVDEYLHLAIHANSRGDHHGCMMCLKEVLRQQPANPAAIHLLAMQHAEIGLYDRAIKGIRAALEIEPAMQVARLQLGGLLLECKRVAEAKEELATLATSRDAALRLYSEAMIALANGERGLALKLTRGLSGQPVNPLLNALMRRLLDRLTASAVPQETSHQASLE